MALLALSAVASGQDIIPVPATQGWHSTGIQVSAGQRLIVEASGLVCIRSGCDTPDDWVDPDGYCPGLPNPGDCYTDNCSNCFVPGLPNGLIGRVGTGAPFVVGSRLRMIAVDNGELQMCYNDSQYADNSGEYEAAVVVVDAVPSIGTYGAIILAIALAISAFFFIRRRKALI